MHNPEIADWNEAENEATSSHFWKSTYPIFRISRPGDGPHGARIDWITGHSLACLEREASGGVYTLLASLFSHLRTRKHSKSIVHR